jgi:poly(3-hydroxybutyrate) depolymerase
MIAAIALALPGLTASRRRRRRRVALIDGTSDGLVPYAGGSVGAFGITRGRVIRAEATFAALRTLAGCTGAGSQSLPGKTPAEKPGRTSALAPEHHWMSTPIVGVADVAPMT